MSLQDEMSVRSDAARKSKKDTKNAKARARRAAKKAAVKMNKEMKPDLIALAVEKASRNLLTDLAKRKPPIKAVPKPVVKVTVKEAVLDLFRAQPKEIFSTAGVVTEVQKAHPGMNENSIRVWVTDFRKDGTIKFVKMSGRNAILKAGKLPKK